MTKRYRLAKDIETPNYYVYRGQELFRLNDDVLILKATDRFIRPDAIREIHFHEKHEIQKLLGDWFTEIKEEEPEHIFWNGKKYEIKEKSASGTRMILKEVKEESPQNSWSDNDMIEFIEWINDNRELFMTNQPPEVLMLFKVYKTKRSCR